MRPMPVRDLDADEEDFAVYSFAAGFQLVDPIFSQYSENGQGLLDIDEILLHIQKPPTL